MSPVVPKSLLIRRIQNEPPIADDDDFRNILFTDGGIEIVDPDTGAPTGAVTWGEILEVVAGVFPLHPLSDAPAGGMEGAARRQDGATVRGAR